MTPMSDRAVKEWEMCPYCEARQMAGHGFPSQECPTCDRTGYVPRTLPDRAMVEDRFYVERSDGDVWWVKDRDGDHNVAGFSDAYLDGEDWAREWCATQNAPKTPQPRALVALSDDRQAIVFLTHSNWWAGHYLNGYGDVGERAFITEDTGQDAQQVLDEWLESRG